jgi:biopolymer transport protein ExbD
MPIQLHSVNLNMPVGNPPPPLVKPEVVKIDIDNASRIYWNGEWSRTARARGEARAAAAQQPQPEMHLRPDKSAKYDRSRSCSQRRSASV